MVQTETDRDRQSSNDGDKDRRRSGREDLSAMDSYVCVIRGVACVASAVAIVVGCIWLHICACTVRAIELSDDGRPVLKWMVMMTTTVAVLLVLMLVHLVHGASDNDDARQLALLVTSLQPCHG